MKKLIIPMTVKLDQIINQHLGTDLSDFYPVNFVDNENTSVTLVDSSDDAYTLLPPLLGNIKDYKTPSHGRSNLAVWRGIIGYNAASKAEDNPGKFVYTVSMVINDGLRQLTRELGDLAGRKISLERPGKPGVIFRDLDGYAGYELRIVVEAKN